MNRTNNKLFVSLLGMLSLVIIIGSRPASAELPTARVDLEITPYVAISVNGGAITMNVTQDNIAYCIGTGKEFATSGSRTVQIYTNYSTTMKVPKSVALHGGLYTAWANVMVVLPVGASKNEDDDWYYISYPPGGTTPWQTVLTTAIGKVWTVADLAGIYSGVLELQFNP